jgi:hypothetical protein
MRNKGGGGEQKFTVVAEEDGDRADVVLLGELDDGLDSDERAAGAAEGAVGNDLDALLFAETGNLRLREPGVKLELDGGGHNLGRGQKLLEVLLAVLFHARKWLVISGIQHDEVGSQENVR